MILGAPQELLKAFNLQVLLVEEGILCIKLPLCLRKMLLARQLDARSLILHKNPKLSLGGFSNIG